MTVEHHHHHKDDDTLIAQWGRKFLDAAKTPPSRTTWLVLVCLVLGGTLIGAWFYFTAAATAASSTLWTKLDLTDSDDLAAFAHDQPTTVQGRYALVRVARRDMQDVALLGGANADREKAAKEIDDARANYQKLVEEAGDTPALMQESLMGAAKSNEALGDLDKAKKYYDQLAHDYPNTALGRQAQQRSKALDDPEVKKQIQTLADELRRSSKSVLTRPQARARGFVKPRACAWGW